MRVANHGGEGRRVGTLGSPEDGLKAPRGTIKEKIARIVLNRHKEAGKFGKVYTELSTSVRTLHPLGTQKTGSIPPTTLIFSTSAKIPEFRIAVSVHECYFALNLAHSGGPPMGDLSDRREARRFTMTLPVRVLAHEANSPELKAHTRDVSYRGLYFLSEARFENGSEIDFILTLPQQMISAGDVNIRCHGRVVRVESAENGQMGVAAKIERYEFVPARASAA